MNIGALTVISRFEMPWSKASRERTWQAFLRGGTNHSSQAMNLPAIINRCEREGIPYRLTALPGIGYSIGRFDPEGKK